MIPNHEPESEVVIEPDKDVKFPINIKLDYDRKDEVMTIVIVHAGAPDLNKKGIDGASGSVSNREATEIFRKLLRPVDEKKLGATSKKFGVEYVSTEHPNIAVSETPGPIQLQILGSTSIAQYEIVPKKQKWP